MLDNRPIDDSPTDGNHKLLPSHG